MSGAVVFELVNFNLNVIQVLSKLLSLHCKTSLDIVSLVFKRVFLIFDALLNLVCLIEGSMNIFDQLVLVFLLRELIEQVKPLKKVIVLADDSLTLLVLNIFKVPFVFDKKR